MQQKNFNDGFGKSATKSLIIGKTGKKQLSKNQEAFNKLTQKIEKLQKAVEKHQLQFDHALKMYGSKLHPAQLKLLETRRKLIVVLWEIYKRNQLSKTDQRHLKDVVQYHLQEYFAASETEPDEILQKIFSAIEGVSYDKMMKEEKENDQASLKEMFEGLDINIEGIDLEDEAAMAAKIAEAEQKMAEMQEKEAAWKKKKQANKKKTAKQMESEKLQKAAEEMKQKNISTIYKQLAKLFHPDLEQDAGQKVEKEILMKELTAAYEAKNLHALLSLELKWIHKETDHLDSLTEEKLAVYLQILREQANDLEHRKYTVFYQPQYAALVNKFGYGLQGNPVQTIQKQLNVIEETLRNFESDLSDFESALALRHVKEMIRQWKQRENDFDEEKMLKIFFGG